MISDTQISFKRILWLLRNDLITAYKKYIITGGAIFGILLIINIASVYSADEWTFHSVFYPVTLLICGLITTSTVFSDMHRKEKGYRFMSLPASMFEKFLEKLILTAVCFTLIITAGYFLFSLVGTGLTKLFFGLSHGIFNPFTKEALFYIALYIVTGSVIFFGATYFRKMSLMKTILVLIGLAMILTIIAGLAFKLIFWKITALTGFFGEIDDSVFHSFAVSSRYGAFLNFSNVLSVIVRIIFWGVMPLYFWFLSFLRIKEKEVL